ncbi:DUF305 domain-containing protein [Noviherbaspirillum sp.]|uniref:DUF305 domain-containing protein n=1 Tax=Noviherbaspirillum sp. TaxID=1926288 RepID=UPI002FE19B4B
MRTIRNTTVVIAAFVISSAALSQSHAPGASHGSASAHGASSAMHGSAKASEAPFDLQFLDTMAAHHQSAIDMAQLVESRAAHDELKKMAMKIIDDQQREVKQMMSWKEQWYAGKGDAVNMQMPGMKESMKGMDKEMKQLSASKGEAFDLMFIDMMTKHHKGAVQMAKTALSKAEHKEVKQIAQKIVDEQQKEISQFSAWKKEWKKQGGKSS